jgi:hypothetical protein
LDKAGVSLAKDHMMVVEAFRKLLEPEFCGCFGWTEAAAAELNVSKRVIAFRRYRIMQTSDINNNPSRCGSP